jgi:hypothetical protein
MYHGEGSRRAKGLAALSGIEMELDNLAGRACDSQWRSQRPRQRRRYRAAGFIQRTTATISCIKLLLSRRA